MKYTLVIKLLVISTLYAPVVYSTDFPDDFKQIDCEIILRVRPCDQEKSLPYTHPLIPLKKGVSNNWCGYVAAKNFSAPPLNSVTAVSGSWVVPTISAPSDRTLSDTYSSLWVGIDGYNNSTVEQIGTAHEWHNNKAVHYAWFEMYPNAAFMLNGFPVIPGDTITACVEYKGNSVFLLTISNVTRKVYMTIPTAYTRSATALRACAEWVAEAPFMGTTLPLAHFSVVSFSQCTATIGGVTASINNPHWKSESIMMKSPVMVPKAVVSPLQAHGESFNVTWLHE